MASFLEIPSGYTASNGNLTVTDTSGGPGWEHARADFKAAGKWYWEIRLDATGGSVNNIFGIATSALGLTYQYVGINASSYGYFGVNGTKINNSSQVSYGLTFTAGDVIGIALDLDAGKIWFAKNGVWQASGDPASGANPAYSGIIAGSYAPAVSLYANGAACTARFAYDALSYSAPAGFVPFGGAAPAASLFAAAGQPYALTYDPVGAVAVGQPYALLTAIQAAADLPWAHLLAQVCAQTYGPAAVLRAACKAPYGPTPRVRRIFAAPYAAAAGLFQICAMPWGIQAPQAAFVAQPFSLADGGVLAAVEASFAILSRGALLRAAVRQPWSLPPDGGEVSAVSLSVRIAGRVVDPFMVAVEADASSYILRSELELSQEDWAACRFGDEIVIDDGHRSWVFFVETLDRKRSMTDAQLSTGYSVGGLSPTARLDTPYAATLTMSWPDGGLASDIAREIVALSGAGVELASWEIVDWIVPPAVLAAANETPLEILRRLIAGRGILQSTAAGNLTVVRQYAVPPAGWATTPPAASWTDTLDFMAAGEAVEIRPGYAAVLVRNTLESESRIWLEEISDDIRPWTDRILKGWAVPWVDPLALTHSGGPLVTIEETGVHLEDLEEIVEIVDGAGRTRSPIHALLGISWLSRDLGGVAHGEDGRLVADSAGNSLARVRYRRRWHGWIVRSPEAVPVQCYVPGLEELAA